jgi:hypothetical protein
MALRDFYGLDRSSAQFPDQLDRFLHDENHVKYFQNLPENELAELLEYLNDVRFLLLGTSIVLLTSCTQVLEQLHRTGQPSRKCFQVLRKICGIRGTLPLSYQMPGALLSVTELPVAFGGFCDVYKGEVGTGSGVCVKKIRRCITDNIHELKQAGHQLNSWLDPR